MKAQDAQKLKAGDKVLINYTPALGHGVPLNNYPGIISQTNKPGEIFTNLGGTGYIWLAVKYGGISSSLFPSWCIEKTI